MSKQGLHRSPRLRAFQKPAAKDGSLPALQICVRDLLPCPASPLGFGAVPFGERTEGGPAEDGEHAGGEEGDAP